jgi:hypothetical protein
LKQTKAERRADALERFKASIFENSRAKRTGTATKEEWEAAKAKEVAHLEEKVDGRKA